VVYTNPVFDENKYLEIYKGDHYQTIVKKLGEDSHIYRKNRFGKERMDFIEKFHNQKNPKSYLDIGCSTGFIIEEGKERGWDTTGIELNPSAVQFGLDRGLNIISEPLETANLKGQFAAISLFDVLEHLIHPKETLERVHDLLVPDGNVFIYVPNYDSAYKMLAGVENAHFIWPTHHLTYFTPLTLKYLLEKVGFEVIHWETQGLDIFDYLWFINENTDFDTKLLEKIGELIQFYINAGGHGKNLRMFARKIK
jgi:2-polyprenyl-3-methyl-5-hydroxy-6-metoxy-1,4-benzoquinol methylase